MKSEKSLIMSDEILPVPIFDNLHRLTDDHLSFYIGYWEKEKLKDHPEADEKLNALYVEQDSRK